MSKLTWWIVSVRNREGYRRRRLKIPAFERFAFVQEIQTSCAEYCAACEKKVYPLEKVETGGRLFHKQCFRCLQCCTVLRQVAPSKASCRTDPQWDLHLQNRFQQIFISPKKNKKKKTNSLKMIVLKLTNHVRRGWARFKMKWRFFSLRCRVIHSVARRTDFRSNVTWVTILSCRKRGIFCTLSLSYKV